MNEVLAISRQSGVPVTEIGEVGGEYFSLEIQGNRLESTSNINAPVERLFSSWSKSLEKQLNEK